MHFEGGYFKRKLCDRADVVEEILKTAAYMGTKIMKLKLSKINLKHEGIIKMLIETFNSNRNLILLNLSKSQL